MTTVRRVLDAALILATAGAVAFIVATVHYFN